MEAQCLICNKSVVEAEQAAHLSEAHPAPGEGFRFFIDMKPYYTDRPSMSVAELKRLTGQGHVWPLFMESGAHGRIHLADAQAVDLTREPRLYVELPAHGGAAL